MLKSPKYPRNTLVTSTGLSIPQQDVTRFVSQTSLHDGHWTLNLCTWELVGPGSQVVTLTHNELRFLRLLSQTPSMPVQREAILLELFNRNDIYTNRSLDSMVRRLRLKIQGAGLNAAPIKTAHSVGYAFSAPLQIL